VLLGFREQTIDIDLKLDPEPEGAFEAIALLKNRLNINVELASRMISYRGPSGIGGNAAGTSIHGQVQFFHYDFFRCKRWPNWKAAMHKTIRM